MKKSLSQLVQESIEAFNKMSLEQQAELRREQRRSFARAEAGFGSDKDEAEYRAALARGDKKRVAELDAEAQERVKKVDKIMKDRSL